MSIASVGQREFGDRVDPDRLRCIKQIVALAGGEREISLVNAGLAHGQIAFTGHAIVNIPGN
mgnify:CR=1 FL=1